MAQSPDTCPTICTVSYAFSNLSNLNNDNKEAQSYHSTFRASIIILENLSCAKPQVRNLQKEVDITLNFTFLDLYGVPACLLTSFQLELWRSSNTFNLTERV